MYAVALFYSWRLSGFIRVYSWIVYDTTMMNQYAADLEERFIRYVQIDTESDDSSPGDVHPFWRP